MPDEPETVWYIARDGNKYGPFSGEDFAQFEKEGQFVDTDFIWRTGLGEWQSYGDLCAARRASTQLNFRAEPAAPQKCAVCLILRQILRTPLDIARTAFELVTQPTRFAQNRIDVGPRDLQRAFYFWLNIFASTFLLVSSFTYLLFYAGISQSRTFTLVAVQIALGAFAVYLLNITFRQPVRLSGVLQGILYIDGVFLPLINCLQFALAYLQYRQTGSHGVIDVISNEIEKCFGEHSRVYWLLRGDLEFFEHAPITNNWPSFVSDYAEYVLFPPFAVIFAKLMRSRYSASLWLNVAIPIMAYLLVVGGTTYAAGKVQAMLVANLNSCAEGAARSAIEKYNRALVLGQLTARLNRQLFGSGDGNKFTYSSTGIVMDLTSQDASDFLSPDSVSGVRSAARYFYCAKNTDFMMARAAGIPLYVAVRNTNRDAIFHETLTPDVCASAAGK